LTALVCFLIAFGLSWFGTMILLRVPTARGFVDVPNERSSHEAPKLRIGGIAIVVSFYAAIGYLFVVAPDTRQYIPLAIGSGMLFLTGVIDDWRGLGVKVRFLMQFMAAITMVSFGVTLDHFYIPAVGVVELGWMAIPATVLVFMVSINFYNFIDGIDGLAAGSAFIASGFLALIAFMLGHSGLALIFVAVAGSSVGFLQFNFPPSRLFMGDSGSTFLGFLFAYMAITGNRMLPELPVFIPVLILSSLYFDAGLTLFNRLIKRENIFKAHHTHYYQRLLSLGLNHKQVTLLEYALMVLLGISAVVYFKAGRFFPVFLSACWIVLFTLAILKIRGLERGDKKLFWEKRTVFAIGLDLLLITISYLGAYFLRMNFRLTEPEWTAVVRALPVVLVVRSFVFYRYGLYLSVYKYTSTADIVRILKAVTMGSAVIMTIVVLLYRFVAFPRTLFVLEFFLLTLLLLGSRFSFRLFHEIGKESHGANVRKIGIIGAGDFGERVARELRNNKNNPSSVRCFIDDDPGKIGMTMLGVPIAGPMTRLEEIVSQYRLDNVVLAIANLSVGRLSRLGEAAKASGIPLECKRGPQWPEPGRTDALFEPLALGLGGEGLQKADLPARVFYRGKRVLLTGGGGALGVALARELIALGASVIVQIDSAAESKRFDPPLRKEIFIYSGLPHGEGNWRRMFETTTPDVVFHCLSLDVDADSNAEDYLWDRTIKANSDLTRAVADSAVSLVVQLCFWNGEAADNPAARIGAVSEALLLNGSAGLQPGSAPKAIRFPRIFTSVDLENALQEEPRTSPADTRDFALLEPEAVALALDCAAAEPGSAVLVVPYGRGFSTMEAAAILSNRDYADRSDPLDGPPSRRETGLMFPAESVQVYESDSTWRATKINSPVYPADSEMARALSDEFLHADPQRRAEWLSLVTRSLYQIAASGAGAGVGPENR
jgi:UDP-GlcNAc:undecaprenyl-phosphate GlcNAc-1-phosphate transferase